MARITTEIKKTFSYFPLTKKAGNKCMLGCDKPPAYADGRSRNDCDDCLFWCFPINAIIDLITMPFRGFYYGIRKCKKN